MQGRSRPDWPGQLQLNAPYSVPTVHSRRRPNPFKAHSSGDLGSGSVQ